MMNPFVEKILQKDLKNGLLIGALASEHLLELGVGRPVIVRIRNCVMNHEALDSRRHSRQLTREALGTEE